MEVTSRNKVPSENIIAENLFLKIISPKTQENLFYFTYIYSEPVF
jgi:hypothetical protein